MTTRTRALVFLVAALTLIASVGIVLVSNDDSDPSVLGSVQGEPTLFVAPGGSSSSSGLSPTSPLPSIQQAIDRSVPGSIIHVSAGTYSPVVISNRNNLTIVADPGAQIRDGRYDRTAAIQVLDSNQVWIEGLQLRSSLFGVMVKRSTDTTLRALDIADMGQEGILIRDFSNGALIEDSVIRDTGKRPGGDSRFAFSVYGEGIYLGTGNYSGDATGNVVVRNNDISRTTSEAIDVKPHVYNVLIENNRVHDVDTNTSGAIVVGIGTWAYDRSNVTIQNNLIWNISSNSPYQDGNGITASADAVIRGNVIWQTEHYGILLDGNFSTSNKTVVVESNAIFNNGQTEIGRRTSPSPGSLNARDNLLGSWASNELGGAPPLTGGQPSAAMLALFAQMSGVTETPTPTTPAPTTPPTTPAPTAPPTTPTPSTTVPVTPSTTQPATTAPTTAAPTTAVPTTDSPTTTAPATTAVPTTAVPTTAVPTTNSPTTAAPTTAVPTTDSPTTGAPTTSPPTTESTLAKGRPTTTTSEPESTTTSSTPSTSSSSSAPTTSAEIPMTGDTSFVRPESSTSSTPPATQPQSDTSAPQPTLDDADDDFEPEELALEDDEREQTSEPAVSETVESDGAPFVSEDDEVSIDLLETTSGGNGLTLGITLISLLITICLALAFTARPKARS